MQKQTFILSNGRVAAINNTTGIIDWEIRLKDLVSSSIAYSPTSINQQGDKIIIGLIGCVLCLSAQDGSLVWKNDLTGWGYNYVHIANNNNKNEATYVPV